MGGTDGWLDEYASSAVTEREVECPACGHAWEVRGHFEYGTWWAERDDDLLCPECGDVEGRP